MNWYKLAGTPKSVALTGTLRSNKGYVYLSVPDSLIPSFLKMLPEGIEHPEKQTGDKWVGAHISVIKASEEVKKVKELGEEFEFSVTGIKKVEPDDWDGVYRATSK